MQTPSGLFGRPKLRFPLPFGTGSGATLPLTSTAPCSLRRPRQEAFLSYLESSPHLRHLEEPTGTFRRARCEFLPTCPLKLFLLRPSTSHPTGKVSVPPPLLLVRTRLGSPGQTGKM